MIRQSGSCWLKMMKKFHVKFLDVLFVVTFPLLACVYLWSISQLPPYGTPLNELSDHYWGVLMDIARQWKAGEFSFWTRSVGGGFCLYSSGFYPLLVPLNIAAKFLSYDQFYIFKMVEPYFIGLAAMALLLREHLRLGYSLVCFGALAYMGFVFTRYVGILHHPFFLWACAFFPFMVFCYTRLFRKHIYLRSSVLGVFMALIFLGGGAGQFAQMIIWTLILLVLDAMFFVEKKSWISKSLLAVTSCFIFVFFSFSIAGVQIIPTLTYTFGESIRTLGEYPINNFPLFGNGYKGDNSIFSIFTKSVFFDGDQGVRAFWALMIFACGKLIVDWKAFCQLCLKNKALLNVSLATLVFFLIPPVAGFLSQGHPFFERVFNPLRMFTFGYCGFLIDMVLVLFLVVLLSIDTFIQKPESVPNHWKKIVLLLFFIFAEVYLFAPLWLNQIFQKQYVQIVQIHFSQRYAAIVVVFLLGFSLRRWKFLQSVILSVCLIFLGGSLLRTSYVWGEKGQRTNVGDFNLTTPEHLYYQKSKHRYYMAYVDPQEEAYQYQTMVHNYDLLFDVDGVNGFLNIPPKRFSNFLNAYHSQIYWVKNAPAFKYCLKATPPALVTHFPVEFTTVGKGMNLPWPGFSKVVDGAKYDVWTRDAPVELVKFAREIKVVSFREVIEAFDRPYDGIIYMTAEDSAVYRPDALAQPRDLKQTTYGHFKRQRPDFWTFKVNAADDVFVLLPEIYQKGWQLRVDGHVKPIFPANYIFLGFALDKGEHQIELKYRPALWNLGLLVSLAAIALFLGLIYFYIKENSRRHETK